MKNRITLKHLIELLRMEQEIQIRNKDNYRLFDCSNKSQALEPYLNREVVNWFVYQNGRIVISIEEE